MGGYLKVGLNGESKLVDEYLLESRDVVLLTEDEHGLLIVHGIHCTEGDGAILVGDEDGIAGDAGYGLFYVPENFPSNVRIFWITRKNPW